MKVPTTTTILAATLALSSSTLAAPVTSGMSACNPAGGMSPRSPVVDMQDAPAVRLQSRSSMANDVSQAQQSAQQLAAPIHNHKRGEDAQNEANGYLPPITSPIITPGIGGVTQRLPNEPYIPIADVFPGWGALPQAGVPQTPGFPNTLGVPNAGLTGLIPGINVADVLVDTPSAPSVPSVPFVPSAPSAPSVPTIPSAPSVPSVPSVPSALSAPSVPSIPSVPSVPSAPSAPSAPVSASVPSIPAMPNASELPKAAASQAALQALAIPSAPSAPASAPTMNAPVPQVNSDLPLSMTSAIPSPSGVPVKAGVLAYVDGGLLIPEIN